MKKLLVLLMFLTLLASCGPSRDTEDYNKSVSVKQFLFDHNYTLRIDGIEKTKYSKEFDCNKDSILELVQDGAIISGMIIGQKDKWNKFPDTDVYVNLFAGG